MLSIPEARRERCSRGYTDFLKKVGEQALGSDLQSGYSFVYVWLANQFGHFMIGFAGTILLSWFVFLFAPGALPTGGFWQRLGSAAMIGFVWWLGWIVFKEILWDLVSGLRSFKSAIADREAAQRGESPPVDKAIRMDNLREVGKALRRFWRPPSQSRPDSESEEEAWFVHDIVRDVRIDGWFYLAGVLTAVAMYAAPGLAPTSSWPWLVPIVTFVVMLVASLLVSRSWLLEKVAFDQAQLPFIGRFALNSRPYAPAARRTVIDFAMGRGSKAKHLIVIGPPKSGRTTTAVALGVEALLRSGQSIVVYTTWCKLLDRVAEEVHLERQDQVRQGPPGSRPVFPPEQAELLIIDDLGAEGAERRPFVTAASFGEELSRNGRLRGKLKDKRIVWVVGDNPEHGQDWGDALRRAHNSELEVEVVELGETLDYAQRRLTPRRAA